MKVNMRVFAAVLLGLFLLIGAAIPIVTQPAQAGPPLAPTPVSNLVVSQERNLFELMAGKGVTADYNTTAMEISSFSYGDVQFAVTQGATVNTTTVTIQYSNDKSNWVNGVAITSSAVASGTDITRVPLFGQYARFKVDVSGSSAVTWTLNMLAR